MIFKKVSLISKERFIEPLNRMIDMWNTGLSRLRFDDNFVVYRTRVTIGASAELEIIHPLGVVPTDWILTRQEGDGKIVDGDTAWTRDRVYLQNVGANEMTVTVLIFV